MPGHGKRSASWVPAVCRAELDKLSKADLMEIAFDLAILNVGNESDHEEAYKAIAASAAALANAQQRKAPKLAADFRAIGVRELARTESYARKFQNAGPKHNAAVQDARDFWGPYARGAK